MKKLGILLIMGMISLWGSDILTIQVINAVHEKSITHDFDRKLKKSGLEIHKVIESGRYIVTLGRYKDKKSALGALAKARLIVAGAFIRPVNRDNVAVAASSVSKSSKTGQAETLKTQSVAMAHSASGVEKGVETSAKSGENKSVTAKEPEAKTSPAAVAVAVSEKSAPVAEIKSSVSQQPSVPVVSPIVVAAQRKAMYKTELVEAINFYKTSPYHRFEPVMLQH